MFNNIEQLRSAMTTSPIHLEALQILDAIDRRGSFAKAAEELDKATSALSYTMQKLEEQLGVTIFQRQGRRSVLTPTGKLLLEEGRKILVATQILTDQARELATGWEPKLRVALESTSAKDSFFKAVTAFLDQHPNVELDVRECVLSGGWEALELDQVDLLVGAPGPVPLQKGFRAVPLSPSDMILVAASQHPLVESMKRRGTSECEPEELQQYRRVVTHDTATVNVVRNLGLTTGAQVLYVQTVDQKFAAQLAGAGIGHLPRKMVQPYLDSGRMVELKPQTEQPERYLAWKISHKGKGLKALSELLAKADW